MYLLPQFEPKVRSGTRVDLKSVMESSPPKRTASLAFPFVLHLMVNTFLVFPSQFLTWIATLFEQSMVPSDPLEYFSKEFLIKLLLLH